VTGTVAALSAAGQALAPTDWDAAQMGRPVIDPRLVLTYQPGRCREPEQLEPWQVLAASGRRLAAAAWERAHGQGEAEADPGHGAEGLLGPQAPWACQTPEVRKTPPARHGTKGLTRNGARQIQRAGRVLNDDMGKLSFWTVTLPDNTIRELVTRDLWPEFQSRIRDLLVRALKDRGLPPRVVGVVELHPSRSMRERLPLPHLHVIFHGSRRRWHGWLLEPADLDRIIRDAVRYVGLPAPDVRSAGNVQPVQKNAAGYLAKYMTKNTQTDWLAQVPGNLPRVWWFWSGVLRAQVLALVVEVRWAFASWLHRMAPSEIEALGAVRVRLELPDPRAPSTWVIRWRSPRALGQCVEVFTTCLGGVPQIFGLSSF
jgi:hypothetical protein